MLKVYIVFQSDFECGGNYGGKVYDSEAKAKRYVKAKNKKILDGWLEHTNYEGSELLKMDIKNYGSKEAYAKHMLEQEEYYYFGVEVQ